MFDTQSTIFLETSDRTSSIKLIFDSLPIAKQFRCGLNGAKEFMKNSDEWRNFQFSFQPEQLEDFPTLVFRIPRLFRGNLIDFIDRFLIEVAKQVSSITPYYSLEASLHIKKELDMRDPYRFFSSLTVQNTQITFKFVNWIFYQNKSALEIDGNKSLDPETAALSPAEYEKQYGGLLGQDVDKFVDIFNSESLIEYFENVINNPYGDGNTSTFGQLMPMQEMKTQGVDFP